MAPRHPYVKGRRFPPLPRLDLPADDTAAIVCFSVAVLTALLLLLAYRGHRHPLRRMRALGATFTGALLRNKACQVLIAGLILYFAVMEATQYGCFSFVLLAIWHFVRTADYALRLPTSPSHQTN